MTVNGHTNGHAPEWSLPTALVDKIEELPPIPGESTDKYKFAKAGFRSYELAARDDSWRLVLSNVDVGKNEPRGVLSVYYPQSAAAFADLGGIVLKRSVSLLGDRSASSVAAMLHKIIGIAGEDWRRRFDYLVLQTLEMAEKGNPQRFTINGRPDLPKRGQFIFNGLIRAGRTISVFGAGSSGKTTIVDGLIVSLCSGTEIIPGWVPLRPYRVVVLDYDEGEDEERVRLYAMTNFYDQEMRGFAYTQMGRPLVECADATGAFLIEQRAEIVVISNVNKALRSDRGDPGGPVHEMYEVLREFGTTNILIDHIAAEHLEGGAKKEYGSIAKRDNNRGSYLIEQLKGGEAGRQTVGIKNMKSDALKFKRGDQFVRINYAPIHAKEDGTYDHISFEQVDADGMAVLRETQHELLVRLLRQHGTMATTQICAIGGFHAHRVRDIVREARSHGAVIAYENGSYTLA